MLRPVVIQPAAPDEILTLSNPRQTEEGAAADDQQKRASFEVDFAVKEGKNLSPFEMAGVFLVARSATTNAEMRPRGIGAQKRGTISFREFIGRLTGPIEISVERQLGPANRGRIRISNVVTLQAS